jgi:GNAT acetyltransferase-like protein
MYFSPEYLVFSSQNQPDAFVSILTLRLPGLKIGLVHRGPVGLGSEPRASDEALQHLAQWATDTGYTFLRFSHSDANYLDRIALIGCSERTDPFPFYRDLSEELIIEQQEHDAQMLANFQPVARRKIKKASTAGYELTVSSSPEAFETVWPLFQGLSTRKKFRYRPLASYLELIRLAQSYDCVRLYVASLKDRPVASILILRDRLNAVYMSGALENAALDGKESPACLLHWKAMRDLYRDGVKYYSLGTRSGAVYQFKRQFRPRERVIPPPVILVMNRNRYRLWCATVHRLAPLWPRVKRLVFK